jgi:glycosyltransferase involved in cell wall biosynthesis
VFNGGALIRGTLESVRSQTNPPFEYWVIDGNSTDNTMEIVRSYAPDMPYLNWLSEPDRGLYDAMNKGLERAKGDFVWFLNAGDHLHESTTLEKLETLATPQTDVLYGDTMLVDTARNRIGAMSVLSTRSLPHPLHWRHYLGGMRVVHQSFVARRVCAPPYALDNLCADFDWSIQLLKRSRMNTYAPFVLSDYLSGGLSRQRHRQSLVDRFKVMRHHFGLSPTLLAHVWILCRAVVHRMRRWGQPSY